MNYIKRFIKDSVFNFFLTLISKCLGLLRDSYLLLFLKTGNLSDAFSVSIRIPNMFRHAVVEGAMGNVLLPKLKDLEKIGDFKRVYFLIINIMMFFCCILFVGYFSEQYFQSFLLNKIAPGFNKEQIEFYCYFIKITGISSFVYALYSIFSSILNYKGYFLWHTLGVIVLNGTVILGVVFSLFYDFSPLTVIYIYIIATFLMMMVVLVPCVVFKIFDESFFYKFYIACGICLFIALFTISSKVVQYILFFVFILIYLLGAHYYGYLKSLYINDIFSFLLIFAPVLLVNIWAQINDLIFMSFASCFPAGSVTLIMRSSKVMQFPIVLIIPVFTTLLSYLTRYSDDTHVKRLLQRLVFCLILIVSFIFIGVAYYFTEFLIKVIYFNHVTLEDLKIMIPIVRVYSFSLPAFLVNKFIQIIFFSNKQVCLPFYVSILNTVLYVVLMHCVLTDKLYSLVIPYVVCSYLGCAIYLVIACYKRIL